LRGRGTETDESLQARLDSAQEAFDLAAVPGTYDLVIINDNQDEAYKKFEEFVETTWGLSK
jgi:guanylate kinase